VQVTDGAMASDAVECIGTAGLSTLSLKRRADSYQRAVVPDRLPTLSARPLRPQTVSALDDPVDCRPDPRCLRRHSWVQELGGPKTLGGVPSRGRNWLLPAVGACGGWCLTLCCQLWEPGGTMSFGSDSAHALA
jgi:hypothetical protein